MDFTNWTMDQLEEYKKGINKEIMARQTAEKDRAKEIIKKALTNEWQKTEDITSKVYSEIKRHEGYVYQILHYKLQGEVEHRNSITIYMGSHANRTAEWRLANNTSHVYEIHNSAYLVCPKGTSNQDIKKWIKKHPYYEEEGRYHYTENGELVIHLLNAGTDYDDSLPCVEEEFKELG